ncbi:Cyclic nucleotide-binding domain protein [Roseovarius litorisediminis]|uniref:Cyclic nucleotide-binding domain protein n=1 Tax=Roseovarius litorisediminis TaxID=1312363 RepID=A0A1Y5TV72_9RHOB|nr:Cyclic nucleotide-binding domain protein [Roseovarius litorisediminis]
MKSVFFIASGAVELESAGRACRLGRGEMFGQVAILTKNACRAEVRAIVPSMLLVLDMTRFCSLLAKSVALQDAVRASAVQRGIDPDVLLMGSTKDTQCNGQASTSGAAQPDQDSSTT